MTVDKSNWCFMTAILPVGVFHQLGNCVVASVPRGAIVDTFNVPVKSVSHKKTLKL